MLYIYPMANFPAPHMVNANGVNLAIYQADGDPDRQRPPVILVHGWPEIAYSWKNQINVLSAAGYRVIALDVKGFGQSDAPRDKSEYDIETMTSDLAALLDALKIERAVFCGHDWGGALAWGMGQWRPERVAGIASVCTPLRPRSPAPPIAILKKRFTDKHYFVQFQEEDAPEQLFETDIEKFFLMMFRGPVPRERWASLVPQIFDIPGRFKTSLTASMAGLLINETDLQIYIDAYRHSGFHGGVNLYRNVDRNWALMEGRNETVNAPSLWIGAELDLFLPPEAAAGMDTLVPDLETAIIKDCGHWITWEKPDELNRIVIDWLDRKFLP